MRPILTTLILLVTNGCTDQLQSVEEPTLEHHADHTSLQINARGIREIEIRNAGQLNLVVTEEERILVAGERSLVNQVEALRQQGRLTLESRNSTGLLTVYLSARMLESLTIRKLAGTDSVVDRNRVKIILSHHRLKIDRVVAAEVCIEMDGHGNLEIDEMVSDRLRLKMTGHGKIKLGHVKAASVDVVMFGHGDIKISGTATSQHVKIKGHGRYDATGLESSRAELTSQGFGRSALWVRDQLILDAQEFGAVHYQGQPVVHSAGWNRLAAADLFSSVPAMSQEVSE